MNEQRIQELRKQAREEITRRLVESGLITADQDSSQVAGLEIAIDVWVTMEIRRLALERFYQGFTYRGLLDLPPVVDTRPSETVEAERGGRS